MKKFILITSLLAAGTMLANAETTVTPLTSTTGWTHDSLRDRATWTQDATAGTLTLDNSNWGQAISTYDFATDSSLYSFSVDITRGNVSAGFMFTLVGTDSVVVVGTKDYTDGTIFYGTSTDTTQACYSLNTAWDEGTTITPTSLLATALNYNATATVTGTTSVNAEGNTILALSVTSTSAGENTGTATIDLGKDFQLDKIMICGDGANNSTGIWKVSNLSVAIPEPSAFGMLAGLGALALVASRRRRR